MTPTQIATIDWLANGKTGLSSEAMAYWLAFGQRRGRIDHPHDPADFDRCLRLLAHAPALREHLPRMAELSTTWAALVHHWAAIEASHLEEVGLGWTKARSAPRTYELMQRILHAVRKAEDWAGMAIAPGVEVTAR